MPSAKPSFVDQILASEDEDFPDIWDACKPFASIPIEAGLNLFRAVKYLVENKVNGILVFCGLDRGGLVRIAVQTLQVLGASRRFVLIHATGDATELAQRLGNRVAREILRDLESTGYDLSKMRIIEGDIQQRIPRASVAAAGLLALNVQGFETTYGALAHLYPRLVNGGVLWIDHFQHEVQQGVDEYFGELGPAPLPRPKRPFFQRIGDCRLGIRLLASDSVPQPTESAVESENALDPSTTNKSFPRRREPTAISDQSLADQQIASPTRTTRPTVPPNESRYDYVPPGLVAPNLLRFFPTLVPGNLRRNKWNYLRDTAPHRWRIDDRSASKGIGVLSVEEATLLYNLAIPLAGRRGLAIGCHFAWSTAHLLAAGLDLDVVDPALNRAEQYAAVQQSLDQISTTGSYRLWAAFSPSVIPAIRTVAEQPWSFVFIDGDHEGDAPRLDAEAVLPHLADTSLVAFHDLVSPYVAAGLDVFQRAGWTTRLFNTMQIMGVAWRGELDLPEHTADPSMPGFPGHLKQANDS